MGTVNQDIREAAKRNGVKLWQVAEVYGINDSNFSRKLRRELSPQEKEKIMGIIENIARSCTEVS